MNAYLKTLSLMLVCSGFSASGMVLYSGADMVSMVSTSQVTWGYGKLEYTSDRSGLVIPAEGITDQNISSIEHTYGYDKKKPILKARHEKRCV